MSEQKYKHIIRLAGTDIPGEEDILQGLTQITGVGLRVAKVITRRLGIDGSQRIGFVNEEQIEKIEDMLDDPVNKGFPKWYVNRQRDRVSGKNLHLLGSDLRFAQRTDIERLKRIRCWRGVRHQLGLKVRGQRTRTTGRGGMAVGVSRKRIKRERREAEEEEEE